MVPLEGIEPSTSRFRDGRSYQLNYRGGFKELRCPPGRLVLTIQKDLIRRYRSERQRRTPEYGRKETSGGLVTTGLTPPWATSLVSLRHFFLNGHATTYKHKV